MPIKGTYNLTKAGFEIDEVRSLIQRRRLQVLVHSCIYYYLDNSIVTDNQWQDWANELVELQRKYPKIAERADYHEAFKDFDGSTGCDLPYILPEIVSKANQLLKGGSHGKRTRVRIEIPGTRKVHKARASKRNG